MADVARTVYVLPEEYALREQEAEFKSEYWDGVIVAMAGSSREHEYIADNLHIAVHAKLRDANCRAFRGISIHIPAYNRYVYPDLALSCYPSFKHISGIDALENPVLVVEVVSKSTAYVDLTANKDGYASIESLKHYVIVSQDIPRVEVFARLADGSLGAVVTVAGIDSWMSLPDIGCQISLAEVYGGVDFGSNP